MNKAELIKFMATQANISQTQAGNALRAFEKAVADELAKGGQISMTGFGIFSARERAARIGRNPNTGEPVEILASKIPAFKAGKTLKDLINV